MKTTTLKKDFRLVFIAGMLLFAASVYAAINLPWGPDEKRENGFLVMANTSKDVNVWSDCKKVTAPSGKNIYVPTATATEWSAFKAGAGNVGATLGPCGTLVNGVCSTPPAFCSAGTKIADNNKINPGETRLWICQGSGGGTNSLQCSYTNLMASPVCGNGALEAGESCDNGGANSNSIPGACKTDCSGTVPNPSCVPNGSYTYGSCSVSCGGGTQDRYDSCGAYYDTVNTNCNAGACSAPPINCAGPWGTVVHGGTITAYQTSTVPYGSSCVSEGRSCNNGVLDGSYTNQNCTVDPAPSYTYAWDSWSPWSDCAGTSCPGIQSRTASTCRRSPDNVVVADSFCGTKTETQSCIGHEKTGMPACASFPNRDVCAPDTLQCTGAGWANLGDGYCKNHNEVLCVAGP